MRADESLTQAAGLCHANGWGRGDVLVGRDHAAPAGDAWDAVAVRLTAVGDALVLAVRLADRRGARWFRRPDPHEAVFGMVARRHWHKATDEEAAAVAKAVAAKGLFDTTHTERGGT